MFGHPDAPVESQNPGDMAEGSGNIQGKESLMIKVITGLKFCLMEEIEFDHGGCYCNRFLFHMSNIFLWSTRSQHGLSNTGREACKLRLGKH